MSDDMQAFQVSEDGVSTDTDAPAGRTREGDAEITALLTDVCDLEPDNPDAADTICVSATALEIIVRRHVGPLADRLATAEADMKKLSIDFHRVEHDALCLEIERDELRQRAERAEARAGALERACWYSSGHCKECEASPGTHLPTCELGFALASAPARAGTEGS